MLKFVIHWPTWGIFFSDIRGVFFDNFQKNISPMLFLVSSAIFYVSNIERLQYIQLYKNKIYI